MTGVNAVVIGVKDLASAKHFYVSFGFEVEKEYPGFLGFKPSDGAVTVVAQRPASNRTPTNRSRCAAAGHPAQDPESPPAAAHAASGTRADQHDRPRPSEQQPALP